MDEYIKADAPGQGHSPGSAAGRGGGDGYSLSQGVSYGHGGISSGPGNSNRRLTELSCGRSSGSGGHEGWKDSSLHTTRLRLIK